MYVLDTNTLIYFFKGKGNIASKLLATSPKEIGVPSIVVFELEVGIAKSSSPRKRSKQLDQFISAIAVLPFGLEESKAAAKIRARLEKQGKTIGPFDILIAATAMVHKAVLVTHNTSEFSRVEGLLVEDWYDQNTLKDHQ